jgi:uncharacterized protein (DUF427 family)
MSSVRLCQKQEQLGKFCAATEVRIGSGERLDYPRPHRCERVEDAIRIVLDGEVIVDAPHAFRVLETSHPPTYYIPRRFVRPGVLWSRAA